MTARLVRLRIAGFKSFAEPVSLDILPGLTGIVGPNGCGKSNVADALRWAMGETSARSLRGGEMDDVIFSGTTARASRNLAEVSVSLEAGSFPLPSPFEGDAELQVTRRIERGAGSSFRANGRELRARDVQTLYADLASGARSSGMVSQGRVAALVGARPEERRQVLEEAAGIAGLHTRRHEAELKLRAAEQNLARAEESRVQLDAAREALRRQARQAARYRAISDLIRAAEAAHASVLHGRALAAHAQARLDVNSAQTALQAAEQEHETAGAALSDAEAALPQPRAREAEARSVLERRRLEADSLAEQAGRAQVEHASASDRLRHLRQDLELAARTQADADDTIARLSGEHARLEAERAALPSRIRVAADALREALLAVEAGQAAADAAGEEAADAARQSARALDAQRHAAARLAELRARHEAAEGELEAAASLRVKQHELESALGRHARARQEFDTSRARLETAEAARADAFARAAEAASHVARRHALGRQAEDAAKAAAARLAAAAAAALEADATLTRLYGERVREDHLSAADRLAEAAEAELVELEQDIETAERAVSMARAQAAAGRHAAEAAELAARTAQAARDGARARRALVSGQTDEARRALALAEASPPTGAEMASAGVAVEAAERAWSQASEVAGRTMSAAEQAARAASRARADAAERAAQVALLSAEQAGLAASLGPERRDEALADLRVPPGLEAAVGAALGEAAHSSLDPGARAIWRELPPLGPPETPPGTVPLATLVQAPAALARALSHAMLLEAADGDLVQTRLTPGLVAVDRDGACWRWDGHVVRAGAPNPAASGLLLRRRLGGVSAALHAAQDAAAAADTDCATLDRAQAEAEAEAGRSRDAAGQLRRDHDAAVAQAEALRMVARQRDARVDALSFTAGRLQADLAEAERRLAEAEAACAALPAPDPGGLADLDRSVTAYEAALDAARAGRLSGRACAAERRQAAQRLAGEAARSRALIEAAESTAERAAGDRDAAWQEDARAQAALAALPDPAALESESGRLAEAAESCRDEAAAARTAREAAETALETARRIAADTQLAHGEAETRWTWLTEMRARAAAELADGEESFADADRVVLGLPDAAALSLVAREARARLEAARLSESEARAWSDALKATLAQAERAAPGVVAELTAWQSRLEEAVARRRSLADRHGVAAAEHAALAARPAELAERAARVSQALTAASATHEAAASALEAAHGRVRALAGAERDAAREAGARREALARAQAVAEAAITQMGGVAERIAERLGTGAMVPDAPDLSDAALDRATRRTERLSRERDEMGPVNLRAELEMAELDERLATLARDREELTTAIAKLRGAIGHLNREGRERLQAVFTQVDQHFRALFTRMMGGGQAHLAWTGSSDPLEAGLDIFAEPPGKKLTSLSLLSGGEQALTALSLIFAVFRCLPAPLCVLDEVDAPLDDANVDRFCALLDEMSRETGTSFLVVTHHQLTMSRMDRLYGVTMQERGVSRLLSVDLSRAVALAEPVRVAAE